jgi:hypothetical protein
MIQNFDNMKSYNVNKMDFQRKAGLLSFHTPIMPDTRKAGAGQSSA